MSSVNKVILVGRLGHDPEIKYVGQGSAVCQLSVATSRKWKSASGQPEERTEWHKCTVWNKTAETCAQYLAKGSMVYVEGELETRKYQDKQGIERYVTEIKAHTVQFLSPKGEQRQAEAPSQARALGYEETREPSDDVPF